MENYKKYTKKEMRKVIKYKGFLIVETSKGDVFGIAKEDVPDFIMLENARCDYHVDLEFYIPGFDIVPLATTYGCFLNKVNQKFRAEIIERLISLQKQEIQVKKIKIFDDIKFYEMAKKWKKSNFLNEMFEKFFRKYY